MLFRSARFSLPPGEWRSPQGTTYRGSVTLAKARSIVLLRSSSIASRTAIASQEKATPTADLAEAPSAFQVYPNPLREGNLTVVLGPSDSPSTVSVHDMTGRLLWQKTSVGQSQVLFPKEQLGSGLRLIKVQSDGHVGTEKVIIR